MRIEKYPAPTNVLPYWAQIPDTYDGCCNIDLHGKGGENWGSEQTLDQLIVGTPPPYAETPKDLQVGCNANNILLLAPQRFGDWTVDDVNRMIDIAIDKFKAVKVGISGFSMGGGGVRNFITSANSNRVSWAICCNGTNRGSNWVNAKTVRTWFFHTQDDNVVPVAYTNDAVTKMRAAGGVPKVTLEPTGRHSYNNFFKQQALYDWMKDGFQPPIIVPPPVKTIVKVTVEYSDGSTVVTT